MIFFFAVPDDEVSYGPVGGGNHIYIYSEKYFKNPI